jgi:hypothetical protein
VCGERAAALWRRGQRGWPRRFPLVQLPNAPLLVALAGRRLVPRAPGPGRALFAAGLGVWAWRELTDGANWVRRLLGAGALAWLAGRR